MSAIAPSDRNKKNAFLYSVQLQVNEIALEMTALCDTGAQTPLVISPRAAKLVADTLGATIKQLPKPIQYVDYRGKIAGKATKFVEASLEIDSRRFLKQRFVITECDHDVFIGLKWLAEQQVILDCKNHGLIWPEESTALAKYSPAIVVPKTDPQRILNTKKMLDAEIKSGKQPRKDTRF